MATHDYVIANGTGAAVRSDLNNALAAIVSNNSGSSEPGTTYAYQWWADTNANVLKLRNSSNDGWVTLRELDGTMLIEDGSASTPGLAFADDTNTGIFSGAADQIGFATGGAERLEIGSSEVVFNDPSNDVDFRVESNGQTHMLFVDAGNDRIGIAENSPSSLLSLGTSLSDFKLKLYDGGDANDYGFGVQSGVLNYHSGGAHVFEKGGSEKARIDSSGRLLVGTSTARSNVVDGDGGNTLTPQFQFETANSDTAKGLSVIFGRNNSNGAEIVLGKHRSASVGGTTIVSDGDQLGILTFSGSDGTNFRPAATIEANVDATPGSSDMPGRLVFSTTADGASSPTERMRLDSSGNLLLNGGSDVRIELGTNGSAGTNDRNHVRGDGDNLKYNCNAGGGHIFEANGGERMRITSGGAVTIGSTGTSFGERLTIQNGGSSENCAFFHFTSSDDRANIIVKSAGASGGTSRSQITFLNTSGGNVGSIKSNGSSTSYNTSSDYRLKENVVGLDGAITRVKQLSPKRFNFLADTETIVDGFLAHEAQAVVPEAVTGTHNEVDDDGNAVMQGIDQSKLVPLLTAALQEAVAKIETLETKVAALEAG